MKNPALCCICGHDAIFHRDGKPYCTSCAEFIAQARQRKLTPEQWAKLVVDVYIDAVEEHDRQKAA